MAPAQGHCHRRFLARSRKNALWASGLGHWRNDCVSRASVPGEDSKCPKSPGPEKANDESTTAGLQRLLEGSCEIDREGSGLC